MHLFLRAWTVVTHCCLAFPTAFFGVFRLWKMLQLALLLVLNMSTSCPSWGNSLCHYVLVPRTHTSDQSFAVAGLHIWNNLPYIPMCTAICISILPKFFWPTCGIYGTSKPVILNWPCQSFTSCKRHTCSLVPTWWLSLFECFIIVLTYLHIHLQCYWVMSWLEYHTCSRELTCTTLAFWHSYLYFTLHTRDSCHIIIWYWLACC